MQEGKIAREWADLGKWQVVDGREGLEERDQEEREGGAGERKHGGRRGKVRWFAPGFVGRLRESFFVLHFFGLRIVHVFFSFMEKGKRVIRGKWGSDIDVRLLSRLGASLMPALNRPERCHLSYTWKKELLGIRQDMMRFNKDPNSAKESRNCLTELKESSA